jgi:hypothetical protein
MTPRASTRIRRWGRPGEAALVGAIAAAVLGALLVQVSEARAGAGELRTAREFQGLVKGLGFGPATDLSGCAFAFDPRLSDSCGRDPGALLFGSTYCPNHRFAVFSYPDLVNPAGHASIP